MPLAILYTLSPDEDVLILKVGFFKENLRFKVFRVRLHRIREFLVYSLNIILPFRSVISKLGS